MSLKALVKMVEEGEGVYKSVSPGDGANRGKIYGINLRQVVLPSPGNAQLHHIDTARISSVTMLL